MVHPLPTLASSLPSPSPSTSGEADEALEPVPQTCSLSPELTSPRKRTAEHADLNEEDDGVHKRPRNEVQAMTPKAMTPDSQISSSATTAERTASASPQTPKKLRLFTKESAPPQTPKKVRLITKESAPLSDKKPQSPTQKFSPQGTDKNLKKDIREKVPKSTFDELSRKRKVRQEEEFNGKPKRRKFRRGEDLNEQVRNRIVRQEEEGDKQQRRGVRWEEDLKPVEFKNKVSDGAVSRDTQKKGKTESITEIEKRARGKLYKRITKGRKDAPGSLAARLKAKGTYIDPSTTSETDDNIKLKKKPTTRSERVDKSPQQQCSQITSAKAENNPATAGPSLVIESTPVYDEIEPVYFKRDGVVGLTNLGNTCFANTVIQALCNTPAFRDLLMKTQYSWSTKKDRNTNHIRKNPSNAPMGRNTRRAAHIAKEKDKKPAPADESLCAELGDLFHVMTYDRADLKPSKPSKRSEGAVVSPREFYESVIALLKFEPNEQHDAQEFLQLALQRMSKELALEKVGKFGQLGAIEKEVSGVSPVQTLFGGEYINKNQCNGCPYSTTDSAKPEDFLCLSLGIPTASEEQGTVGGRKFTRSKPVKRAITLESCLEHFVSPELVHSGGSSSKAPFCSTCGPREGITKTLKLSKCSQYLCVQLKRFQWGPRGDYKDTTIVKPPIGKLDLGPYMTEDSGVTNTSYDLHTVIVHAGDSCSSGHYIAYTKTHDGTWWKMNDDKSSIVSTEEVVNSQAYMMFFSRNDANTDRLSMKHAKSTSSP
ncbi:hypothetical protein BGX38DRAFT_1268890 [Terfezia claveryi]|nr:hypothetical protein BGX38DRAFT_1268890 [Terfezia claveryi]